MDIVSYLLGKKSGGGGTTDYDNLSNKPSINDVELTGNKTLSDLGIQSEIDSTHKLSADLVDDSQSTNKFVSQNDKDKWNARQVYYVDYNDNNNPFVFLGKKKGIYIIKSYGTSSFKYKFSSEESSVRTKTGVMPLMIILNKDVVESDRNTGQTPSFGYMWYYENNSGNIGNRVNALIYISNGNLDFYGTNIFGIGINSFAQTFSGVKTFSSIPKQSNTTAPTDDKEFTNKKYVDDQVATKTTQYSTMPTASVDYLDKIVQFIGTTDSTYTNGYFYKCVSDGQEPATYSWEMQQVQQSSGGGDTINFGLIKNTGSNSSSNELVLDELTKGLYFLTGDGGGFYYKWTSTGSFKNSNLSLYAKLILVVSKEINKMSSNEVFGYLLCIKGSSVQGTNGDMVVYKLTADLTNSALTFGEEQFNTFISPKFIIDRVQALSANSKKVFDGNYIIEQSNETLPTDNKQYVIKKYVDNKPTTYTGYDATKTQVLKNINGTLTWVDEI